MNKQYLLMVDEPALGLIKQCFMGLNVQFLEVQGMGMANGMGNVLVTPTVPPVPPMPIPAQPLCESPTEEVVA